MVLAARRHSESYRGFALFRVLILIIALFAGPALASGYTDHARYAAFEARMVNEHGFKREELRRWFDAAERKRLYDRVQEILHDEQPYTWVYAPKSLTAYDRRFQGVTWYPTGATQEPEWWVPVASQKYR